MRFSKMIHFNQLHIKEYMMKTIRSLMPTLLLVVLLFFPATVLALEVGDSAPNFTAESTRGKVSLADYAGKQHVVLALYFAVFTPV